MKEQIGTGLPLPCMEASRSDQIELRWEGLARR
jgi:hypothetical protein